MGQVRFRVMPNAWFILVRYYLRVDNVVVRIFDTRMYHEFGTNFILREFKHQESDYEKLRQTGFNATSSEWMLSTTQADEVSRHLPVVLQVNEKLIF